MKCGTRRTLALGQAQTGPGEPAHQQAIHLGLSSSSDEDLNHRLRSKSQVIGTVSEMRPPSRRPKGNRVDEHRIAKHGLRSSQAIKDAIGKSRLDINGVY